MFFQPNFTAWSDYPLEGRLWYIGMHHIEWRRSFLRYYPERSGPCAGQVSMLAFKRNESVRRRTTGRARPRNHRYSMRDGIFN